MLNQLCSPSGRILTCSCGRLTTFSNFKLPHLQFVALRSSPVPPFQLLHLQIRQMWNDKCEIHYRLCYLADAAVEKKYHYNHGLMELLRWPPAVRVDFDPPGCRSGDSSRFGLRLKSLSWFLKAEMWNCAAAAGAKTFMRRSRGSSQLFVGLTQVTKHRHGSVLNFQSKHTEQVKVERPDGDCVEHRSSSSNTAPC